MRRGLLTRPLRPICGTAMNRSLMKRHLVLAVVSGVIVVAFLALRWSKSAGGSEATTARSQSAATRTSADPAMSTLNRPSQLADAEKPHPPSDAAADGIEANIRELPRSVVDGLRDSSYRPRRGEVPLLSAAAESALLRRYGSIVSISDKYPIALVLAYGGGDRSASALANTLTNEYRQRPMTLQEEDLVLLLPIALGETARRSSGAFHFLASAADPNFWQQHCTWSSPVNRDTTVRGLTGSTLKGLGLSGRPEALQVLLSIRTRGLKEWPRPFRAGVVDAAFVYDMVRQHGESYLSGRLTPNAEELMGLFRDWRASPDARPWIDWAHMGE